MARYIDADELPKVKFHALPYTHIVPSDLKGLQTEAYERGWNDAIDAIVENAETADVVEAPRWVPVTERLPNANEKNNRVRRYYLVQNEYSDMMVASWNGVVWEQMYQYRPIEDKVVAWMPLPEPWKGEDDG